MASPIHVLHVDDDADFLELVATYLERESDQLTVSTANNVEAAHDQLDATDGIECIVSDYEMPGTDGLEFLETVRGQYDRIPFILYTGKGSEEIASEAISAGVTEYVHKATGTEQYTLLANTVENAVAQYRAERQVHENERRFRALIENSTDIISILDEHGRITYQSPSAERVFGLPDDEVLGEPAFDFVHPDDRERVMDEFFNALEHGDRIPTVEYRLERADGSWRRIESTGMNRVDDPAIEGFIVNSRDITERETLRSTVQDREQKIKALHDVATQLEHCDSCSDAYTLTIDAAERILDFEMCVIGIEDDGELVVRAASEDIAEDARTRAMDEGLAGKTHRTGESYLIHETASVDEIPGDSPYRSVISIPIDDRGNFQAVDTEPDAFDQTDLELAELLVSHTSAATQNLERTKELERKNQRLEEFSSVISHDLRSPLNIAEGMIGLAKESGDLSHLSKAETALDRMNELIENLLTLAKEGEMLDDREPVAVADVAGQAWSTSTTGEASLSVAESLGVVSADRSRFQTLFENLFRNAVEHSSTSNRSEADDVHRTTSDAAQQNPSDSEGAVENDGSAVTVEVGRLSDGFFVADDGPGIPNEQRQRLNRMFDDRSLQLHEREGFGLVIVQQIVEAHDWQIRVAESDSGGARFDVTGATFLE
ncbi:multi-sensor signal transduction histidine kinase (plasmid) [halophilic archaeon DL31]|nr:multi-sensor signal transduction histidine kinase [halophilic archaeon DL31]